MASKVWLAEPNSRYELKGARRYGEIAYFHTNLKEELNPLELPHTIQFFAKAVNDFNPKTDYLCMTGFVLTVGVMLAEMAKRFDRFNILLFDARSGKYVQRTYEG